MGSLTLQNFRDDLTSALGQTFSNTQLDRWINQALKEFAYAFRFHELEEISSTAFGAGTPTITVGILAGLRYVEEIEKLTPLDYVGHLLPETRSRYLRNIGDTTDSTTYGNPLYYHRWGGFIYCRPIADVNVNVAIQYYKRVTALVNVGDVSQFDEDWDEVIFTGALYRGFRHLGEFDRYQNVRNDFLGIVRSRKTEYELEEFPEGGISPLAPGDTEAILGEHD